VPTIPAPGTVVVLPARWAGVLPVAAVPVLRAARTVYADQTVSDEVCAALGATRPSDAEPDVWITTDPTSAGDGAEVVAAADPPGAVLLDAVAVMDRLRSPGGCPWDAEQTHESLLPYLIEECYELYQAVEDGDRAAVREELGDVLLQVLFHARVAAEGRPAFDIDGVALDLVTKLMGRHPHVFAPSGVDTAERIDTAERQQCREAARIQCGRRAARPAGDRTGRQAGQPDGPGRPAGRVAPSRPRRRGAAVRGRRGGQAGRNRPGSGAAHRCPPVRRHRARRRTSCR
jgi:XTP/dITP diphosphohydrolase